MGLSAFPGHSKARKLGLLSHSRQEKVCLSSAWHGGHGSGSHVSVFPVFQELGDYEREDDLQQEQECRKGVDRVVANADPGNH